MTSRKSSVFTLRPLGMICRGMTSPLLEMTSRTIREAGGNSLDMRRGTLGSAYSHLVFFMIFFRCLFDFSKAFYLSYETSGAKYGDYEGFLTVLRIHRCQNDDVIVYDSADMYSSWLGLLWEHFFSKSNI